MQINEQHLPLLHALAWKFHRISGIDPDDLYGEACVKAVQVMQKYNPDKGAISTFLYKVIWNHFLQYSHTQHQTSAKHDCEYVDKRQPDISTLFSACMHELNPFARKLYRMITNDPDKFMCMGMKELTAFLLSADWTWTEIRFAFKDIKNLLKNQ